MGTLISGGLGWHSLSESANTIAQGSVEAMTVRTAVIPAAGRGTRFLPLTGAIPKELLPLGAVPALQYVIDEAVTAGIERFVLVVSPDKDAIRRYVVPDAEVIDRVRRSGREDLADRLAALGSEVEIRFVVQDQPLGLGHAVHCAVDELDGESFAVLLPDEVMGTSSVLTGLIAHHDATGHSVVGLRRVPRDQVGAYGVVDPVNEVDHRGVVQMRDVVEKPPVESAPSDLIIIGRYVLTPDIMDHLARLEPGAGGELQLTDALRAQAALGGVEGIVDDGVRHDTGTPEGWVRAVVDLALADPRSGADLARWLRERLG